MCKCLDFTEPESREHSKGWLQAHENNKNRLKATADNLYDVVFVGDGMVEMLNGQRNGMDDPQGQSINKLFKKTFTKEGGGEFDALALGIAGDQVCTR
jgi:hypothetical protein